MFEDSCKGRFDLYDSRKQGWTITIELAGKDSLDGTSKIVLELEGYNPYTDIPPHHETSPSRIRWIREPDGWNEWSYYREGGPPSIESRRYDTVLGVLPALDAPLEQLSPVICPGTYLVLGHDDRKPHRVLDAPVSFVFASYTDYGQ